MAADLTAVVTPAATGSDVLTAREGEIVRLLAHGLSNSEIAAELVVELSTVKAIRAGP